MWFELSNLPICVAWTTRHSLDIQQAAREFSRLAHNRQRMTREGTINEELLLQQQQQKDDESDVWTSFEQSVTYLKQVAAIYQQTFRSPQQQLLTAAAAPRKKVTKARLDEAKGQAQEALELLASNLLNASTAVVSTLETQVWTSVLTVRSEANTHLFLTMGLCILLVMWSGGCC